MANKVLASSQVTIVDLNDGVSIVSVDVEYAKNSDPKTPPKDGWKTTAPDWEKGTYIWSRTKTTYSYGEPTCSQPACITGGDGQDGAPGSPGRSVVSIAELYKKVKTKDQQAKPTGSNDGWSATPPVWESGYYIHTCSKITYDKAPLVEYTTPICDNSWEAINEIEIGGRNYIKKSQKVYMKPNGTSNYDLTFEIHDSFWQNEKRFGIVTISFDVQADAALAADFSSNIWFRATPWHSFPVWTYPKGTTEKKHYTLQVNLKSMASTYKTTQLFVRFQTKDTIGMTFTNVKLEIGDKATDWTPSPEDIVIKVEDMYYHSTDISSLKGGSWSTTLPTSQANKYIWVKTVTTYATGDPVETTPILYQPGWIQEWSGTSTMIGGTSVLSPKIFAGTKNSDNTVTGIAMGSNVFGNGSDWSGIVGYQKGVKTFHFQTDGSLLIGKNKTGSHISWDGSNLSISANSLKIGSSSAATTGDVSNAVTDAVGVKDTRNTNENPQWYITNYPKRSVSELKSVSVLGLPTTAGTYGVLETIVPWVDSNSGLPIQTFSNDKMDTYERRATSTTAWGAWSRKVNDTQSDVYNALTKGATEKGIYLSGNNLYLNATMIKTGTLSADVIAAGTITADKIAIKDLSNYATLKPNIDSVGGPNGGTWSCHKITSSTLNHASFTNNISNVKPGDKFRITGWIWCETAGQGITFETVMRDSKGTYLSGSSSTYKVSKASTYEQFSLIATVPAMPTGFSYMAIKAFLTSDTTTVWLYGVGIYRMTNGELIVDGAINGHTIIGATIKNAETSPTFQVTSEGELTCSKANITGKVTASSGKIAGFTISGDNLVGSKVGMAGASGASGTTPAFWAGSDTASSAPFKVGHNGSLLVGNKSNYYLEWTGSSLNIKAASMSIGTSSVATSSDIDKKLDVIEIGGANLQNNTIFEDDLSNWRVGTGYTRDESILIEDTYNTANFERTGLTANAVSYLYSGNASIPAKEGDQFTASAHFYCAVGDLSKIDAPVTLGIWYYNSNGNSVGSGKVEVKFTEGKWVKHTYTSTAPANTVCVAIVIAANRNGKFNVGKPKLEKGKKATDWTPSAEDIQASIIKSQTSINDNIDNVVKNAKEEVLKNVKDNYTLSSDFKALSSTVSSQLSQTASDITASFSTAQEYAREVDGQLQKFKDEFSTYIRFSSSGMEIGKTNSVFTSKLDNTKLAFCQNGEEIAYISNNKMYITTADIEDELRIGDKTLGYFVWIQGSAGNLSLKWSDK